MEPNTERIARLLATIEQDLRTLRQLVLTDQNGAEAQLPASYYSTAEDQAGEDQAIEGVFDGEKMVDYSGKGYQVSANYASKSKLVEGDPLKLYVTSDGKFYYKQLGPVPRKSMPATIRQEGNHYVVDAEDGNTYNVLTASVTYYISMYNLRPGDKVMIMIPSEIPAHWAVIDNLL